MQRTFFTNRYSCCCGDGLKSGRWLARLLVAHPSRSVSQSGSYPSPAVLQRQREQACVYLLPVLWRARAGRWQMERWLGAAPSSDAPGAGRSGAEARGRARARGGKKGSTRTHELKGVRASTLKRLLCSPFSGSRRTIKFRCTHSKTQNPALQATFPPCLYHV